MAKALTKKGFRFIEVLSPCPTYYQRKNNLGDGLAAMRDYKERSKVRHGAPTYEVAIVPGEPIIVGEFVDREREDYLTRMRRQLGTHYVEYEGQEQYISEDGCGMDNSGGCGSC
jgi:2-oxoglutarate ferredoxin oxidoreductase subunit beta